MRQGLQCSEWGKPVPGLEPTKLSEPMWTLFFELHAGPWRTTGHDKRPDTRPIEAPRRNVAEKITLPNRGHPHTPRRDPCHKPESCASPNRSPKREFQPYPDPPSRRLLGAAPASYDAGRRGHPPHQFRSSKGLSLGSVAAAASPRIFEATIARAVAWALVAHVRTLMRRIATT